MTTQTDMNITQRIENCLEELRPYMQADGGDVKIVELTPDGVVRLEFTGACGCCSMSNMTFKAGIEQTIKKTVPEIREVVVVNLGS